MNEYVHDGIVGCPDTQADYWELQHFDDNCAPTAEASIIKQFGYDYDQDQFAYISAANGWYTPGGGTSPEDIGNMMDLFNIPNHTVQNAGVADLIAELSQGHGVIVGVRSEQLWDQGPLAELKNFVVRKAGLDTSEWNPADHAIVVTGMDFSDPSNPMVLVNDSGEPGGQAHAYPLDRFVDAWQNSDFYYTATNNPLPSMAHDTSMLASFNWNSLQADWDDFTGHGSTVQPVLFIDEDFFMNEEFLRII
ncbi:MAG: C39 family peptidase [Kiritimatiellae bacterium]|nr:C39 family peptidase [Kiritimatiellia bacterium]